MSSWLLSIIGVIFLGVMLDIVYPNGKTNAFCKGMFGIFAVAIILSPVFKLKNLNINVDTEFIDENFIMSIDASKSNNYKLILEQKLTENDVIGVSVEIQGNSIENEYCIENIYVDTSEIVLSKNLTNINKYEVITEIILETIDIEKERIIIYG